MRSATAVARVVALLVLSGPSGLLASSLFAHGGAYRGPTDTVPPNVGPVPGDPTGPGGPVGPGTPGPNAPIGPSSPHGGGPGTAPPSAPPGGIGRGGVAGATVRCKTGGYDQWEFWWENNDAPYLQLKAALLKSWPTSHRPGQTGRNASARVETSQRVRDADRDETILPALLAAAKSDRADVADSALLALARILPAEKAELVLPLFRASLHHGAASVREAATLAFGVVGAPEAIGDLRALLLDTSAGRAATNHPTGVERQVRAFAAAALGLIGAPESAADLERVARDTGLAAPDDVRAVALLALGMLHGGHEEIVPFLQDALADRSLSNRVRAEAPIALARIADAPSGRSAARAALNSLVKYFAARTDDFDTRRSIAIALGRIGDAADPEVVDALLDSAANDKDTSVRDFSLIALAELGGADRDPAAHPVAHRRIRAALERALDKPAHVTDRPYGALALSIYARNSALDPAVLADEQGRLGENFARENNPSYRGALAIGLGLLGATDQEDPLATAFDETRDASQQGYVAVALGLLRSHKHADAIRTVMEAKGTSPKLGLQLARALGLMGDPKAVGALTAKFLAATTTGETAAVVEALGLIGDRTAIAPLVRVLGDDGQPDLRRGLAAVGLGLLCEKGELPWNSAFTVDSNYLANTAALSEIFDIL